MNVLQLLHAPSSSPDWATIVGAIGGAVSALVLVLGAVFAQRYAKRASAAVEATVFARLGGLALHVRPCIQSSGLVRLVLDHGAETAPTVSVVEHQFRGGEYVVGEAASRTTFKGDDVVDPGETVTDSEIFLVSEPAEGTLGWRVRFVFTSRRWPSCRGYWWWAATTFVPVPRPLAVAGTSVELVQDPRPEGVGATLGLGGDGDGGEVRDEGAAG